MTGEEIARRIILALKLRKASARRLAIPKASSPISKITSERLLWRSLARFNSF